MISTKKSENPLQLEKLGLSHSRLNERYHSQSMERIQEISVDIDVELSKVEDDNLESVSQRGENRKYSLTGFVMHYFIASQFYYINFNKVLSEYLLNSASSDVLGVNSQLDFDFPDLTRSEDDKGSYIKGHPRYSNLFEIIFISVISDLNI